MEEGSRLTRMEIYSGSLVIFVGLFFLLTSLAPLMQNQEAVPFSRTSGFYKMVVYGALNIFGAILLFMKRKPGWAITTGSLLAIAIMPIIIIFGTGPFMITRNELLPILFILLAIMALMFMFKQKVRKNQRVNNLDYLLVFLGYLLFFGAWYFL